MRYHYNAFQVCLTSLHHSIKHLLSLNHQRPCRMRSKHTLGIDYRFQKYQCDGKHRHSNKQPL